MQTIATFWTPGEAHLLRLRLCEAGIPAFIQDEHITQIHPRSAAALGGVRVQVAEADFDAAKRLVSAVDPRTSARTISEDPDATECCLCHGLIGPGQTRCSSCGWSYEDGD
jgi:hypothetical protein